jgi:hypothetical protein
MEIYCKDKWMLHNAIFLAEQLNISNLFGVVNIKRLPPTMPQKGLVEFSKGDTEIDIFIKYDNERFITLAHEMVHVRQILTTGICDEIEAGRLEKTLKTLDKASDLLL